MSLWYQQDVSLVLVVVMCVFIVCQTPTFVDHILSTSLMDGHFDELTFCRLILLISGVTNGCLYLVVPQLAISRQN